MVCPSGSSVFRIASVPDCLCSGSSLFRMVSSPDNLFSRLSRFRFVCPSGSSDPPDGFSFRSSLFRIFSFLDCLCFGWSLVRIIAFPDRLGSSSSAPPDCLPLQIVSFLYVIFPISNYFEPGASLLHYTDLGTPCPRNLTIT